MLLNDATREAIAKTTTLLAKVKERQVSIYNELAGAVKAHAESNKSIPEVAHFVSNKGASSLSAMRCVAEAAFEGTKLTNQWNVLWAPGLSECLYDAKSLMLKLKKDFNDDDNVQGIKTSAEKERQFESNCIEPLLLERDIVKLDNMSQPLGKYVEGIVYALDRMQRMIENLDKMSAREMWVSTPDTDTALKVINSTEDEFKASDFSAESPKAEAKKKADYDDWDDDF